MSKVNIVNIILQAHLPYVKHTEYPRFLEEDWLFESMNESYIPLLRVFQKLSNENVGFKITMCFSPTLITMLTSEELQQRFLNYMDLHIELGEKEIERTKVAEPEAHKMAIYYYEKSVKNLEIFKYYNNNILEGYKELALQGKIELITTAATHCFLPLYRDFDSAIDAQISVGLDTFFKAFGFRSKGFWLPECGYYPGLEKHLEKFDIEWCQLPTHSIVTAKNKVNSYGYSPVNIGESKVKGFVRDWNLTNLVWSNTYGYPCDSDYREFYRDIGYDLPLDYIGSYIHEPEVRVFTGYKYRAITGKSENKKYYDLDIALSKVDLHSDNMLYHIQRKGYMIEPMLENSPVYNLCFDAELFGHRWFEGILFLEQLLRKSEKIDNIFLSTPSLVARKAVECENIFPNTCSWLYGGCADTLLDGSNSWIYKHTTKAITRMQELANRFPNQTSLRARFLNQAGREVLLAMASDWPYIMHDRTSSDYARNRIENHIGSFNLAYTNMCKNAVNTEWLINAEKRNSIFPDFDYNIFA